LGGITLLTTCHVWAVFDAPDGTGASIPVRVHTDAGAIALVDVVDEECGEDGVGVGDGAQGGGQTEQEDRGMHHVCFCLLCSGSEVNVAMRQLGTQ